MRLWRLLVEKFEAFDEERLLWHGLKVFAIDVSTLTLPEALWPRFGSHKACRGDGPVQSPLAVLYDLISRVPVVFRMGRADAGERSLAKKLFSHLKRGSLLVFDNGLYSIEIFAMLLRRSVHFLTPMRANGKPRLIGKLGRGDGLCEIRKSRSYRYKTDVPDFVLARVITVHRAGFRPRRLITSLLDAVQYPAGDIAELYHERWHIETFFREYKHTLNAQRFHARTEKALHCEVVFQMLLCTLTRLAMADAAQKSGVKPGEISFTKSLCRMKNILEIAATLPLEMWPHLYEQLIEKTAASKTDKRPGRVFERDRQKRRRQSRARRLAQLKRRQKDAA